MSKLKQKLTTYSLVGMALLNAQQAAANPTNSANTSPVSYEQLASVITYQPDAQMFSYVRETAQKIWENGNFSQEVKSYYEQIFSRLDKRKDLDLTDPQTLKNYLALKKLVKYKDKVAVSCRPGNFDETSPFLGEWARAHTQLKEKNPPAFRVFSDAIYDPNVTFYMIPKEDQEKAEALGNKMLKDELGKYNLTPEQVFSDPMSSFRSVTMCSDLDNPWNDWMLQVILDTQLSQPGQDKYLPFGVAALHELGHVRQQMPGQSNGEFEQTGSKQLAELAPTIDLIVRQDEIYKEIHGIPLTKEVQYTSSLSLDGKPYSLGKLANRFRQIKEQYGFDNFEQVLITKEANDYINSIVGKSAHVATRNEARSALDRMTFSDFNRHSR